MYISHSNENDKELIIHNNVCPHKYVGNIKYDWIFFPLESINLP